MVIVQRMVRNSAATVRRRVSDQLLLVRVASRSSALLTAGLGACVLIRSVIPTALAITVGQAIDSMRFVGGNLHGSHSTSRSLIVLAALFVAQQIVAPVQEGLGWCLSRRVRTATARRLIYSCMAPTTLDQVENDEVQNLLAHASGMGVRPGMGIRGLASNLAARLQGVIALALVARFSIPLAALLLIALARQSVLSRRVHGIYSAFLARKMATLRRASYLHDLLFTRGPSKEIRIFGINRWILERFESSWKGVMEAAWRERAKAWRTVVLATAPVLVLLTIGIVAVAEAAARGRIALGIATMYLQALLAAQSLGGPSEPDVYLAEETSSLRATEAFELALAPKVVRRAEPLPLNVLEGVDVALEGVSFGYPGTGRLALDDISLTIHSGETVALVGANGAGKSTLVNLLCGLYRPTSGRLTVNGIELGDPTYPQWQASVAGLSQHFVRLPLSVKDNIGINWEEHGVALDDLRAAAKEVGLLNSLDQLPQGWNTVLSPEFVGGSDLSGGEWQKVAIARALVLARHEGAALLALDEPTAHLDPRSEAAFMSDLLRLTLPCAVVLVSHRFASVRRADRVVVLQDGHIAEVGPHRQLVESGGVYAQMFAAQRRQVLGEATG